jgi:ribose-phosphate pyrophosphokinase
MKSTYGINVGPGSLVYREFQYPAGELQVRILPAELEPLQRATEIRVTARLRDGNDLMRLALLASAIQDANPRARKVLSLPYLPYARADRRFTPGDCFGLKAFGEIVNGMHFDAVVTLDAHSAVAASCIANLIDASPIPLISRIIVHFARRKAVKSVCILFPDEGARSRYTLPSSIGSNVEEVTINVLHCQKRRNAKTGALTGFKVPYEKEFASNAALIVDDICDGGGTFIGIADALKGHGLSLGLYVTHGIFSKGFSELGKRFDRIYTTNSVGGPMSFEETLVFPVETILHGAIATSGPVEVRA